MPIFGKKQSSSAMPDLPTKPSSPQLSAAGAAGKNLREKQDVQQLKTFTRWWNSWLQMRGITVTDLCEEIKPGVISMNLIELLSASVAGKYNKSPSSRFQMLENNGAFLAQLKSKNIRLVNIGPEDLTAGNRTLILGLTWTLILRYEIQKFGAEVDELLRWVKLCTKNFEGVDVTNWHTSFNDGLALSAILNKHSPESLNYDEIRALSPLDRLNKAFDVAEKSFGVPKLLDPDEMVGVGKTDDKSVIVYVAKLRQAFADQADDVKRRIAEEEAARLATERAEARKATAALKADFERGVNDWSQWTTGKKDIFGKAAAATGAMAAQLLGASPDETNRLLAGLRNDFRGTEKPPRAAQREELQAQRAALEGRLTAEALEDAQDAAAAGKPPSTANPLDGLDAKSSSEAMQKLWGGMEAAESGYEAALLARLAALEKEAREKETDDMLQPLIDAAKDMIGWTNGKTKEMNEGAKPENLGSTPEKTKACQDALGNFRSTEKPPKEAEKVKLQEALREVANRKLQEGRDEPHPLDQDMEKAWKEMEKAAADLERALAAREHKLNRDAGCAETDKLQDDNQAKAKKWLAEVEKQSDNFASKVKSGELGATPDETQRLLDGLRANFQAQAKPALAKDKAGLEGERREVEARRQQEEREPPAWQPPTEALSNAWKALGGNERDYEKALMDKLGALKKEEEDRLGRQAKKDNALAKLAELLPPLMERTGRAKAAAQRGADAAKSAAALLPWVEEETAKLAAKLAAPPTNDAQVADELGKLSAFNEADKQPALDKLLDMQAACNEATAVRQAQRAGSSPGDTAPVEALAAAFAKLSEAEAALKMSLVAKQQRMLGPTMELERLRRGCRQVSSWVLQVQPITSCAEAGATEGEVLVLLEDAERVKEELKHQQVAAARLEALGAHVSKDAELAPKAAGCLALLTALPALAAAMARRTAKLLEELERQRRLAKERQQFGTKLCAFRATVVAGTEVSAFPIALYDTSESIAAIKEEGVLQAEGLLPAPEGATDEARQEAQELLQQWAELFPTLPVRQADSVVAHRAALHATKLHEDYKTTAEALLAWHGRCLSLLSLAAGPAAVKAADLSKALDMVEAQRAEGDAHTRLAEDLVREMQSYGVEGTNPCAISTGEMRAKLRQIKEMSRGLKAAAAGSPTMCLPEPVVEALQELGESHGDGRRKSLIRRLSNPTPQLPLAALEPMPADQAAFVREVTPSSGSDALQPGGFDPFPADKLDIPDRALPKVGFDPRAHAFAVVEAVNRARTNPPEYADALAASLAGCYSGQTFSPPWGGRLKTEEGEANLLELLQQLRVMAPRPALRLLHPLSEAAQQLAEEVAASAEGRGKHNTSLEERLKARGKWAGAGGEAVVYSVRQPDAVVAMLLLGDGDSTRRNRTFLLRDDLKVAGVGLADHAKLDSVGVLTLVSMFAINLPGAVSVECQGDITPDFQNVIDAIPSEQARDIATEALVKGKKVLLEYELTGVAITVSERDGSKHVSRLKWG
mmetsp:Transcript_27072/g.64442  ORF Transcript_27072/g.64442 Transcript_27072/m.64442 type:complete len:1509 (-) Transcript_27072:202-4728(-)